MVARAGEGRQLIRFDQLFNKSDGYHWLKENQWYLMYKSTAKHLLINAELIEMWTFYNVKTFSLYKEEIGWRKYILS